MAGNFQSQDHQVKRNRKRPDIPIYRPGMGLPKRSYLEVSSGSSTPEFNKSKSIGSFCETLKTFNKEEMSDIRVYAPKENVEKMDISESSKLSAAFYDAGYIPPPLPQVTQNPPTTFSVAQNSYVQSTTICQSTISVLHSSSEEYNAGYIPPPRPVTTQNPPVPIQAPFPVAQNSCVKPTTIYKSTISDLHPSTVEYDAGSIPLSCPLILKLLSD